MAISEWVSLATVLFVLMWLFHWSKNQEKSSQKYESVSPSLQDMCILACPDPDPDVTWDWGVFLHDKSRNYQDKTLALTDKLYRVMTSHNDKLIRLD